jgi:ATPase subunit of ABC transporter with duplicated ATPase domains
MSIIIRSLTYTHPDRDILFDNINFAIARGDRAALVGNNGTGKSTLLQVIAGKLQPSSGDVMLSEKPWYVPQHLGQYNSLTVAEVLQVDHKIKALHAILEGDAAPSHFTDLDDDWGVEEKVWEALTAWQLGHLELLQPLNTLSGGEKTKLFLCGTAIHAPGIILLDEPSNHLDARGRDQLYGLISQSKSTILMVSHDRELLNMADHTLELSKSGIRHYGGNYELYKEQKAVELNSLQLLLDEKEKSLKQTQQKARDVAEQRQKAASRGKAQGRDGSLPRILVGGRKAQAEQSTAKLQETQQQKANAITADLKQIRADLQPYQPLKIDFKNPMLHKGKVLVDAKTLNFGYGEKMLWEPLSFQIRSGDRILISGDNGSGKTTLLKLIMGELLPATGEIYRTDVKYIYLDQEYSMIKEQLTVLEQVQQANGRNLEEHELRSLLHYAQFAQSMLDKKSSGLSGGEKMKLALCCLAVSDHTPDIMILDEPTNNLDIQSLEVLTAAVKDFGGTILIISHDRNFANEIMADKRITLC